MSRTAALRFNRLMLRRTIFTVPVVALFPYLYLFGFLNKHPEILISPIDGLLIKFISMETNLNELAVGCAASVALDGCLPTPHAIGHHLVQLAAAGQDECR
jgi:hypothetical protein